MKNITKRRTKSTMVLKLLKSKYASDFLDAIKLDRTSKIEAEKISESSTPTFKITVKRIGEYQHSTSENV